MTTLHVRVESKADFDERVLEKLRMIDAGEIENLDGEPVLSVPNEETLGTVLHDKNLELIRTTANEEPKSLRELARLVDRDIKNVSRAVNRLAEIGLIELESAGRAKQPRVPYDELEVTYPISDTGENDELTA